MKYSKSSKGQKAINILNQADSFFYDQKDKKAALELYDEVLKKSFSFSDYNLAYIYRNRGNCLQSMNFHYEAIADFNKSIDLNGEVWLTYFLRSLSFGAILKNDEKKKDILKALELLQVDSEENKKMKQGLIQEGMGDPEEMILGRLRMIELDLKSDEDHYKFLAKLSDPDLIRQTCEIRHNSLMQKLERVKIRGIK